MARWESCSGTCAHPKVHIDSVWCVRRRCAPTVFQCTQAEFLFSSKRGADAVQVREEGGQIA
eukprot:1301889-Pyramimonas_sp.AAC.1